MVADLSSATVAVVGFEPLQAEKMQVILCADARVPRGNVAIEASLESFIASLDERSFEAIVLGSTAPGLEDLEDLEVIRHLSALSPACAIIYATEFEDARLATAALAAGAQDVIVNRLISGQSLTKALVHGMERARMRADLRAKNHELARLNEEKNRFLGMAAHDLRGPIGTIGGLAELTLADAGDRLLPDDVEALETIRRSSAAMVRLIGELLEVSRIESGKQPLQLSNVRLKDVVDQCVVQCSRAARRKGIEIETGCSEEATVCADSDKLAQVMDNLLSNAVKFSPPGSKVRIEGLLREGGVEVRVRDWGPGISEVELSRLFDPFYRGAAKPTAGEPSTGLGLPIVKGIVAEHGGEIGVTSEIGVGSTFWVRIPEQRRPPQDVRLELH